MPLHSRMRGFDRDLIRGKHYGQRSCEPHLKGRTHGCTDQVCYAKILLANPEPMVWTPPFQPVEMSDVDCSEGESSCRTECLFLTHCRHPIENSNAHQSRDCEFPELEDGWYDFVE